MKKAPVHAIYKRYDAFIAISIARSRVFAGMKWKFFGMRKRRERTFIHNLCPLCGRRWGASSADRVGRDPCVPPRSTHCSRRGTRAPPYRVRRSHGADRVVRPYTFCAGRGGRRPVSAAAPRCKAPSVRGAVGAADWRREKPRDVSPSASASRCHLPRRGRLWSSAPLTNPPGWV